MSATELARYVKYSDVSKIIPKVRMYSKISACDTDSYINHEQFMQVIKFIYEDVRISIKNYDPDDYIEIQDTIRDCIPNKPEYNPRWTYDGIYGEPSIVTPNAIYDVKITNRFGSIRSHSIIQGLIYVCLSRQLNLGHTHIGLILPVQCKIMSYDISKWNHKPFWNVILSSVSLMQDRCDLYPDPVTQIYHMSLIEQLVGYSVDKDCLMNFINESETPFQICTNCIEDGLGEVILKSKTKVFVHSPLSINLSNPKVKNMYECRCLTNLLTSGEEYGVNGVVVHCGKGRNEQNSAKIMKYRIDWILDKIDIETCYLLIETSSGQGNEILCSPESFSDFYMSLEHKDKCKICVDTCHVFAAGYDPMFFIEYLVERNIPIGLIHFNDSKHPKGCRKDRHAAYGDGYVGDESLMNVINWAHENGISCVREY